MLKKLNTMLFHEELFTRSQCTCCQSEITGQGVECLECYNGKFRLCMECFDSQTEMGLHNSNHQYKFFDCGSMVLSLKPARNRVGHSPQTLEMGQEQKWKAREEIRLLDAIEQYGFGNWQDISKHIETKTSVEAKSKYVNRYVDGTLGQLTWSQDIGNEVTRNIYIANLQKPFDHTIPSDDGPLSPSLTQRLPPLDIGTDEMLQLGYMPNRDDYEKEYDNEAEKLVSQLSFTAEDEDVDVGLKLALVDMYTKRLRERARRKRMIRDYQLVSKFFRKDKVKSSGIVCFEWNTTKDVFRGQFATFERSLINDLRPYIQYFNSREFEFFIRNMSKEAELKFRLAELFKYRRNGIVIPEECSDFERTKGSNVTALRAGKRNLEAILEHEEVKGRSGNKKAHLDEKFVAPLLVRQLQLALPQNSPNSKSTPSQSTSENDEKGGESPSAVRNLTQQQFSNGDFNLKSYMGSSESGRVSYPQEEPKATQLMEVLTQTVNENSSLLKEKQKGLADQFTADYTPSADLVTETEFQFCLKVRITPAQYLTLKTALLLARKPKTDNQQSDELREVSCPPGLRQNDWEQVITFFKSNYC